jgi:hypothetical protein
MPAKRAPRPDGARAGSSDYCGLASSNTPADNTDRGDAQSIEGPAPALADLFAAHFRYKRAIDAARRWISKSIAQTVTRNDVVAFLGRRREKLPEKGIQSAAEDAMERFLNGRANQYPGPR